MIALPWIIVLAVTLSLGAGGSALAQSAPPDPLQQLVKDWGALNGSLTSAMTAQEYVAKDIQAIIEDSRLRRDAEDRLKWVLDNWVHPRASGSQ